MAEKYLLKEEFDSFKKSVEDFIKLQKEFNTKITKKLDSFIDEQKVFNKEQIKINSRIFKKFGEFEDNQESKYLSIVDLTSEEYRRRFKKAKAEMTASLATLPQRIRSEKSCWNKNLIKKWRKDIICSVASLEIPALTYLEAEKMLEGLRTLATAQEYNVVAGINSAVNFIINENYEITPSFIKNINYLTRSSNGSLRSGEAVISGTSYRPPIVTEEGFEKFVNNLNKIIDPMERAVFYMIEGSKMQFFNDGNKRTSQLVANAILLKEEGELFQIQGIHRNMYMAKLRDYYENENKDVISFVKSLAFSSTEDLLKIDDRRVRDEKISKKGNNEM